MVNEGHILEELRPTLSPIGKNRHFSISGLLKIFYVFFMQYYHISVLFSHFLTLLDTNLQASSKKTLKKINVWKYREKMWFFVNFSGVGVRIVEK